MKGAIQEDLKSKLIEKLKFSKATYKFSLSYSLSLARYFIHRFKSIVSYILGQKHGFATFKSPCTNSFPFVVRCSSG